MKYQTFISIFFIMCFSFTSIVRAQAGSGPLTPELIGKFQALSPSQKGEISKKYNDTPIFKQMGFMDGKDAFTFCGAVQNYKFAKYSQQNPPDPNGNMMQKEMSLTKMRRDNCQARVSELVQQGYWNYDAFSVLNNKYFSEVASASDNVKADGGKKLADMVAKADKVSKAMIDTYPQFIADQLKTSGGK